MSNLKIHALRLKPGMEVKTSLEKYVEESAPNGVFIMSCCGSVTKANLRMAADMHAKTDKIILFNRHFEVLAMNGTISPGGTHLHICLSCEDGSTIGGHVIGDLEVFTTMEVMLGEPTDTILRREMDPETNYRELIVVSKN